MQYEVKVMSAQEIVDLLNTGKLNPDPIAQRPAVSSGVKKSVAIIRALMNGYGCGMLTLRDIRNDPIAQAIYGCDYLVVDGGHRCRALKAYYTGKILIDGEKYIDSDFDLSQVQIPVEVRTCSSKEATILFKNVNTTTPTNFMEMVMSDEESKVCEYIRRQTSYVREYTNEPHAVFEKSIKPDGKVVVPNWIDDQPNPRRRWDEFVAIAIIRSLGKGLVDAGQSDIEQLVDNDTELSSAVKAQVDNFLDAMLGLRKFRKFQLNDATFSAFSVYYFGLVGKYGKFKISNESDFYKTFMGTYTRLTGKQDHGLEGETIKYKDNVFFVKEFCRKYRRHSADSTAQKIVFDLFTKHANCDKMGITVLDSVRSLTKTEREEALAAQGYACAIDGQHLELDDAVFGHDTPWCKGGRSELSNGAMIRAEHNRDMGTVTLDEYRLILSMRNDNEQRTTAPVPGVG